MDLDCGNTYSYLSQAVSQGLVSEDQIDVAVKRLFKVRFELGLFDPVNLNPYNYIPPSTVNSQAHQDLAAQMARESIVLLKNDKNVLPLNIKKIKKIAVIGPNANDTEVMLG